MGSFAADHVIGDPDGLRAGGDRSPPRSPRDGWLVTIGIEPTQPSTAFGYIRQGGELDGPRGRLRRRGVRGEAERRASPGRTSRRATTAGTPGCSSSGRPCCSTCSASWHPDFAAALREIAAEPGRLDEVWPTLTRIAIDHAVAEPAAAAGRVADGAGRRSAGTTSATSTRWPTVLGGDGGDLRVLGRPGRRAGRGEHRAWSCRAAAGWSPWSGVDDVVVVDTPDAVLVTTRDRAQDVKAAGRPAPRRRVAQT